MSDKTKFEFEHTVDLGDGFTARFDADTNNYKLDGPTGVSCPPDAHARFMKLRHDRIWGPGGTVGVPGDAFERARRFSARYRDTHGGPLADDALVAFAKQEVRLVNGDSRRDPNSEFLTDNQHAECSIADVRLALKVHFDENESKPLPDTALRSLLLNADRLAWELGQPRLINGDSRRQSNETGWIRDAVELFEGVALTVDLVKGSGDWLSHAAGPKLWLEKRDELLTRVANGLSRYPSDVTNHLDLADIGNAIKTQDNRATALPLFAVQQKRRIYGIDPTYSTDGWEYVIDDNDEQTDDKAYYIDIWEFVTGGFTEQGCKNYITANAHNLKEPRVFAYSAHRNTEWERIRNALIKEATT